MKPALRKRLLPLALVSALLSGCAYTNVQRPLSTEFNKTPLGTKTGKSSSQSILWLVAWGDAGIRAAAENGGITVIHYADLQHYFLLFGLYSELTTIVYGD